ncbi:methyltransferase [Trypanosoma conorhini]|uniref:Methyltransferase n=1 Tax=Trypanosoma conorhini TaxID=83891 RepID=A0A422PND6_9TRYP|nr:methyltransferase [Trypanosoma conorhini]RNF19245.1 methyltransferase [Trypanosoma conorhini]
MRTTEAFKRGEIICPVSADYALDAEALVLLDGRRLKHDAGFNATIVSRFLIATKDLQAGEEVLVNLNALIYEVEDATALPLTGFKKLTEEEKQQLYMYADEHVRQQAVMDGFIPNRSEGGITVVQTQKSQLVPVSRGAHEPRSTVFASTGVLLPFPVRSTIELPGDQHLRLTGGSEFIRHSCQPNLQLELAGDSIRGIALRFIEEGEELTCNYLCTEWDIAEPFHCACNTDSCYAFIRGFCYLDADEKARLLPNVSAAIKEKYNAPLPRAASLASIEKTTALAVTFDGRVAAQRYIASGTVLMKVDRLCVRPREAVLDGLHIPHSCDANAVLLEGRLTASRPLLAGDPLTLNLSTLFYALPLPFECHCGAVTSTHLVKGFSALSDAEKNSLMSFAEHSVLVEAVRHGLRVQSSSPCVKIRRHPFMGEVTYAATFIPKGSRVFHMRGLVIPFPTIYTVYLGDGNHLLFADGAQCLAHSCNPNTRLVIDAANGKAMCVAMRDIEPEEIVSFNYLTSEWDMASPFKCGCGSASCFGMIKGFRHLDEESQLRLWPYATSGVKSLFAQYRRSALSNLDTSLVSLHEASGELRLARDLPSGVVLFAATTFCIAAEEVVLDDVRLRHSCRPTAVFLEGRVVLCQASLRGEAVTLNINHLTYDTPAFACHCGAENCVGEVRGFAGLTAEQQNTEMVYVDPRVRATAGDNKYCVQSTCSLVEVKPNGPMGQATFAKADIREGTRFFKVSGLVIPFATIYTILLDENQHLLFADGAQCLAHSCNPNVRVIIDSTGKKLNVLPFGASARVNLSPSTTSPQSGRCKRRSPASVGHRSVTVKYEALSTWRMKHDNGYGGWPHQQSDLW